jgi:hypothetical protein
MSELGVLDLSGYGQAANEIPGVPPTQGQRMQRQDSHFWSGYRSNPGLIPAAAAMSFNNCRFGQGAPLVMAQRMGGARQQTAEMSPLIQQQTGVDSMVAADQLAWRLRAQSTPEAFARGQGWIPGAGVSADVKAPWQNKKPMGVRATITAEGGATAGFAQVPLPRFGSGSTRRRCPRGSVPARARDANGRIMLVCMKTR